MSNHGYVKSRKFMRPEEISKIIEEINQTRFKGNLVVEYHKHTPEEPGWGEHTWIISYISSEDKNEYIRKVCWLETSRTFEMRHGGGGDFAWWLDRVIVNEVALFYDGVITDDGDGSKDKGKPNYYLTFLEFEEMMLRHIKEEHIRKYMLVKNFEWFCPPELKVDFGPAPDIRFVLPNGEELNDD